MKAHLIDTHLLVPRSRSSAKVKVKYQGHVSHFSFCMTLQQQSNTPFYSLIGSFQVVNSDKMDEVISLHHRKEEISDIKFSPGMYRFEVKIDGFCVKYQKFCVMQNINKSEKRMISWFTFLSLYHTIPTFDDLEKEAF